MSYITAASGQPLYFLNPDPETFTIEDIARSLSRTFRFANQSPKPYSVAQHSVIVARYVADRGGSRHDQLIALLHDAPEAFTGDITRPFKQLLGDNYRAVENALWLCISEKLLGEGVPRIPALVKHCDDIALATEARDVMPKFCKDTPLPDPDGCTIVPVGMEQAEAMFMSAYKALAWLMPSTADKWSGSTFATPGNY